MCNLDLFLVYMSRTNIDLNDTLVHKALKLTGAKTKRELVHKALEELVQKESRKGILKFEGKIRWEGTLEEMRKTRYDSRRHKRLDRFPHR